MAKQKVAVVGLGIMGHGMAQNFVTKGYETYVWNRTSGKAQDLVARGAVWCASPQVAAQKADVVIEIVSNDEASRVVWTGAEGILAGATREKVILTSASLSVPWTLELSKLCKSQGLKFLDSPVTGGRAGAENGQLQLLVGGDAATLDSVRETLAAISKKIYHFGESGAGMRFKLILNTLQTVHNLGLVESLKLAEKVGLDIGQTGEALLEMGPSSPATKSALDRIVNPSERVNFALKWMTKDVNYANQMATQAGQKGLLVFADVQQRLNEAMAKGNGDKDVNRLFEFVDF
jgi:3-hydroxyisobutyrate dehydrogenase-like beta-hydroxyacid dehydrogenase